MFTSGIQLSTFFKGYYDLFTARANNNGTLNGERAPKEERNLITF
jgi:hypothetical protein